MRRNTMSILLLLLMRNATAQIEGNVVDTSGNAIPGAVIIVVDPTSKRSDTVKSDKMGFFEFKKLKRGNYKVVVTISGFQDSVQEKILVTNETSAENPGGDDISNAIWLEIVMRRLKPTR
mgnify:CR=1 FL=1